MTFTISVILGFPQNTLLHIPDGKDHFKLGRHSTAISPEARYPSLQDARVMSPMMKSVRIGNVFGALICSVQNDLSVSGLHVGTSELQNPLLKHCTDSSPLITKPGLHAKISWSPK